MHLIPTKILVSIFAVIGLVFISERNPKIGGLLAGLPLGVGILMFFYAMEQGQNFAISGIPYAIAGLTSSLAFGIGFYSGGKFFQNDKFIQTAFSTLFGILFFFISGFLISLVNVSMPIGIGIFLVGMIISIQFFNSVPKNKQIKIQKYSFAVLIFRAFSVTIIVLGITGSAKILSIKWAGILASFPTMLFPVLTILSFNYRDSLYPNVLKHFSYSISTLFIYYLLIQLLYPRIGIYSGTALAYLICLLYLFSINKLQRLINSNTEQDQ